MTNVQVFTNEELNANVRCIMNEDGSISMNAEDTARGFGFVDTSKVSAKSGAQQLSYIRWNTLNGYLRGFGFSQDVAKDDYIPETMFYLLCMKANNAMAQKFQLWISKEISTLSIIERNTQVTKSKHKK